MSKAALNMLTRTLAVELGPLGITINSIAPGAIEIASASDYREKLRKASVIATVAVVPCWPDGLHPDSSVAKSIADSAAIEHNGFKQRTD
jgi:NAD(P)-dependent dehydrogenase (short-subunit alcohol dehydrogenase family)